MKYAVEINVDIAWGDMDAFQHVNNIMFFKYFESARIKYFDLMNMHHLMKTQQKGPILAQASCQFIKPLTYPDQLKVGATISSIGNSSIKMDYFLHSEKHGLAAKGESIIVMIDYKTGKKINVPEEIRQTIAKQEGWNP